MSALAAPFTISLPTVMQHLKVLEESGLVRTQKNGRVRTCQLHPAALSRAVGWIAARRQFLSGQIDRLEAVLRDGGTEGDRSET